MREILFRGKRVYDGEWEWEKSGEWVYGGYAYDDFFHLIFRVRTDESYGGELCPHPEDIDVIPETVGQFTGLFDRAGRKIFEGDIVEDCTGKKEIVEYSSNAQLLPFVAYPEHRCWEPDECMVVGNIHDNPELFNRGADNE